MPPSESPQTQTNTHDKERLVAVATAPSNPSNALLIRSDAKAALAQIGWTSVASILESTLANVVRRVAARDNCTIEIMLPNRSKPTVCFLKRHRETNFVRWLAGMLCRSPWQPAGKAEADAVHRCQINGVPVMATVATGWQIEGRPWKRSSFFLSECVPGSPADQFWIDRQSGPSTLTESDRQSILFALADTARIFHEAGLFHRDFYWCHFFVETTQEGAIARLIDLQRVLHRPWLAWRWRLKDLAQFVFSMPADLTSAERRSCFARYLGRQPERWTLADRFGWLAVRVRARFYALREWLG